ncbi:hypothetical protein [Rhodonellum sp.]|uniref:hypothetical protein n=1 Tax=Rhodonellum sp. TaxID=2231180 RepID=UPI002727B8AB|nr:hypothetical protein [Rhodonellum sp.]MDO9553928.1 hypothetical protein [Rhodonellum sp.]
MQESWKFDTSGSEKIDDLKDTITETLSNNVLEMGIFLSYYYKKEGAVVENVKQIGNIELTDSLKGKLTVGFDLIYFNACLNINEQGKEKMDIEFEFDKDIRELKLIGPYWPERGMDEI